jgi:general secretion pathway protein G
MIKKSSFSLLEMMVVIAIIGFIAGMLVVELGGAADEAAVGTTKGKIKMIEQELIKYKLRKRKFPDPNDGLEALVKEGFISDYKDSWQNDLQYNYPGTEGRKFDLWSLGADSMDGGEGFDADIYNGAKPE